MTSAMTDINAGAAGQPDEPAWREPGQAVPEVFRKSPALRYTAEGGAIVGRDLALFNNRPLYCAASVCIKFC